MSLGEAVATPPVDTYHQHMTSTGSGSEGRTQGGIRMSEDTIAIVHVAVPIVGGDIVFACTDMVGHLAVKRVVDDRLSRTFYAFQGSKGSDDSCSPYFEKAGQNQWGKERVMRPTVSPKARLERAAPPQPELLEMTTSKRSS